MVSSVSSVFGPMILATEIEQAIVRRWSAWQQDMRVRKLNHVIIRCHEPYNSRLG